MRRHLDHPLAGKTGLVSEARALLYDSIGPGPHRCHWCGDPVEWTTGKRGNLAGVLVVDHVDCDPLNDSLNNLVASCGPCNGSRSPERRVADDELFIVRSNGTRLRAVERICEKCGDTFLAPHDQVRIGKGRFCSRSCARQQKRS